MPNDKLTQNKVIALRLDDLDRRIIQTVGQRTGITAGSTVMRYILREYARLANIPENTPAQTAETHQ